MTSPILSGDTLAAVRYRSSHLQIIASAGTGKIEVVAQRFAQLVAGGADPAAIIVGTIHAYCFRLLQQHEPRYEMFDVLDKRRCRRL
jgi:DNA helicase-2/ATP-dependent DNA helicase PcrA